MKGKLIVYGLMALILFTVVVSAYTYVADLTQEKEDYIQDKADELRITKEEYMTSLIENEYLADNPEQPYISIEEELTEQAINLIYNMADDKSKLTKAITELNKIKSGSVIGEIVK